MKGPVVLAICAALAAGAAQAQETTRSDVRCVLAFAAMVKNPAYKDGATAGLFYYVGRLDGRAPGFDLAAALKQEGRDMQLSDYPREAQRCGAEVKARNEALKALGGGPPSRGVGG